MNVTYARLLRCALVWLATTVAAALVVAALGSDAAEIASGPGPDLETALVRLGSLAVLGCVAWAWLATTAVVVEAVRGRDGGARGVPAWLRRMLLAACGVALAGGLTAPAHADPGPGLDGLPLPDRASDPASRSTGSTVRAVTGHSLIVRPGDSLWSLAAAQLGPTATPADVDRAWRRLYALNRPAVGPDPDLILPGLQLRLPTPTEEPS